MRLHAGSRRRLSLLGPLRLPFLRPDLSLDACPARPMPTHRHPSPWPDCHPPSHSNSCPAVRPTARPMYPLELSKLRVEHTSCTPELARVGVTAPAALYPLQVGVTMSLHNTVERPNEKMTVKLKDLCHAGYDTSHLTRAPSSLTRHGADCWWTATSPTAHGCGMSSATEKTNGSDLSPSAARGSADICCAE
jgi:hypothetical protein